MQPSGRVAVGHPIDVASGVMFNTFTDCRIGGALPLTFERYYSTALLVNPEPGPLGPGFRHGYEHELRETLEGYAYTDAHGVEHTLVDPKDELARTGRLIAPALGIELRGDRNRIEIIDYGSAAGRRLRFARVDASRRFRFESVVSKNSAATRLDLTYDDLGRLAQVTQTRSGRRLALFYDPLGRLAEVWLEWPRLRVAAFEYDASGRLVGVADSVATKVRYEYDANDRMVSEARRGGAIYTFRYDADGRCVYSSGSERFEERTLRYFPTQAMTEVIDSHGAVTRYHYNQAGQIVEEISPVGSRSQYQYDERGKLVFALEDGITQSALEYDELGRLTAAAAPDGRKMRIDYDDEHRPVRCTDLKGRAWEYRYEHGRLTGSKNPLGDEWQYRYDDLGDVIEITNPLGHSERFFWDAAGNPSSFVSPDGATWTYTHDELGRVVSVRDPTGAVTQFTYDAAGNQLSTQTADGRITRYEYDNADRLLAEYRPDGGVIRYRHNTCGQLVECVEADGRVLRFEWDTEPGRILAIVDGAGKRLSYEYDAAGRPIVRRNWDGVTQTFEYTPAGRLQAIVGPGDQRIEFEHDAWGRITRRKDPDGSIVEIEHDDEGPKAIRGPMGEVRYERDLYGRVLKEEQNGIAIENEYDRVGRLLRVRSPLGPEIRMSFSAGGLCTSVALGAEQMLLYYDPVGREVARELPGGGEFTHEYDRVGRIVRQAYTPPKPQALASVPPPPPGAPIPSSRPRAWERRFDYDSGGHIRWLEDSLRGSVWAFHDPVGELRALFRNDGSSLFFEYDRAGNRIASAATTPGTHLQPNAVLAVAPGSPLRIDYGVLRRVGAAIDETTYDPGNRIVDRRGPGRWVRFHHDAAGRLVTKEEHRRDEPMRVWHYEWSSSGTLSAVATPDGERFTYEYDPLGRRTAKHGPSGTTRYVWCADRLLHVLEDGKPVRTRAFHPYKAHPLAEARGDGVAFLLEDQIGSVSEAVDAAGRLLWMSRKGVWAEPAENTPEGEDGFPGQIYDPESGLYYNHHRYYDPELGRYISPDPIGLLGGFNEYAYVPSPLEWLDPEGLALTGGPYPYDGPSDDTGRPALRQPGGRVVVNPRTGRGNTVEPPRAREDGGGKTLAVVEGGDLGGRQSFVSGHGKPTQTPRPPSSWETSQHGYGNWCHAEIQALTHLANRGVAGSYRLYIDRPPCPECSASLRIALKRLAAMNIDVTVEHMETDPHTGEAGWKRYPPC